MHEWPQLWRSFLDPPARLLAPRVGRGPAFVLVFGSTFYAGTVLYCQTRVSLCAVKSKKAEGRPASSGSDRRREARSAALRPRGHPQQSWHVGQALSPASRVVDMIHSGEAERSFYCRGAADPRAPVYEAIEASAGDHAVAQGVGRQKSEPDARPRGVVNSMQEWACSRAALTGESACPTGALSSLFLASRLLDFFVQYRFVASPHAYVAQPVPGFRIEWRSWLQLDFVRRGRA